MNVVEIRRRQFRPLARRLPDALAWQPAAVVAVAGALFVAGTAGSPDAPSHVKIAGVAMAAALAYTVDDAAATTLDASPVTRLERRGLRLFVVTSIASLWWLALVGTLTIDRVAPVHGLVRPWLELAAYTALGLAVSARRSRHHPDAAAGTAGAVTVLAAFGSTHLPMPRWWPLHPGDDARFLLVLIAALAALVVESLDRPRN